MEMQDSVTAWIITSRFEQVPGLAGEIELDLLIRCC